MNEKQITKLIGASIFAVLFLWGVYVFSGYYSQWQEKKAQQEQHTREQIEFDDLWDNTKYDIDHIYPQSKTMDDSLNNRVLVKKEYNSKKSDDYPISSDIQKKQGGFWKSLLDGNFITKEKYERLVRKTELTSDELAGFIERQIVETRQSTKVVADLLKKAMPDSEIVYVKARSVSKFRQDYDFVKVRDMNDLHHQRHV